MPVGGLLDGRVAGPLVLVGGLEVGLVAGPLVLVGGLEVGLVAGLLLVLVGGLEVGLVAGLLLPNLMPPKEKPSRRRLPVPAAAGSVGGVVLLLLPLLSATGTDSGSAAPVSSACSSATRC